MKRKKTLGIVGLLVGLAGGVWWLGAPRHGGPRSGSVKVTSVSEWGEPSRRPSPFPPPKPYFWTTGGDLLHTQKNPGSSTDVVRDHLTPSNTLRRDTASPTQIPANCSFLQPTPDGSGLLYEKTNYAHSHDPDIHLLTSDGKADRLLPALTMLDLCWMPDGKRYIVTRSESEYLNSLDGTPFQRIDTKSLHAWTPFVLGVNRQARAIATTGNEWFEAPDPSHNLLGRNYPAFFLEEFDPRAFARSARVVCAGAGEGL